MFGFSMSEILVISIVILVFVNPKDLPKFIYQVGKIFGQLQKAYQEMVKEIKKIEQEVKTQIESTTKLESDKETSVGNKEIPASQKEPEASESVTAKTPHQLLLEKGLEKFKNPSSSKEPKSKGAIVKKKKSKPNHSTLLAKSKPSPKTKKKT